MRTIKQVRDNIGAGTPAVNVLRLAANVADGETVTINGEVFEIDIINTDSTINIAANMNNTDAETVLAFAGHGRKVNDLIRVDNEIMRVVQVVDSGTIKVARARAGTSIATHTAGADIFVSDAAPATNYPVGLVTTLTPTVASAALVNAINDFNKSGVVASALSVNEILLRTKPGEVPRNHATTETLAGANNAWAAAAMYGAFALDVKGVMLMQRAANATEVALDAMRFVFPFAPAAVLVQIRTSAGALKTWDGAVTISGSVVSVGNGGSTDWAATDVIAVLASE